MQQMNFLVKPASGACNMRCGYCFYADEMAQRSVASYGRMSAKTLEALVRSGLETAQESCTFAFQGGEPTLAGLDFFEQYLEFVERHNKKGILVHSAIQTNGYALNESWARFFAKNRFLVGLSLDGGQDIHNKWRWDKKGSGSFEAVMQSAQLLREHEADCNVLCVVTAQTAQQIGEIYAFYRKHNLLYQQYIPCLDPLGETRGEKEYSLTPKLYGSFLKQLFDLWFTDITAGRFIYIRYFENLLGMLLGHPPESCGLLGHCSYQYVIEADGGVYPCDFYALDAYRLGNINTHNIAELDERRKEIHFIEDSVTQTEKCRQCAFLPLCRGGCRRDCDTGAGLMQNYFCQAYKMFFNYAIDRICYLAKQIKKG